jgi:hypothetical protein
MPILEVGRVSREVFERDEEGNLFHTVTGSKRPPDTYRFLRSLEQIRELRRETYLAEDLCPDCRTALDDEGTCGTCGTVFYSEDGDE